MGRKTAEMCPSIVLCTDSLHKGGGGEREGDRRERRRGRGRGGRVEEDRRGERRRGGLG